MENEESLIKKAIVILEQKESSESYEDEQK